MATEKPTDTSAAALVRDLLPLPASTDPTSKDIAHGMDEHPTDSHALAMADHDVKGAAQMDHNEEVVNLGWNEDPKNILNPLVGGIDNESLWILVRRFNRQTYHFKEITTEVSGGLDLNTADEEEYSPDKLRSNTERLYMTVIVGMMGVANHIARIRSWRERRRTAAFAGAYLVAWALDLLIPLLSITLITLIVSPEARLTLFPPAPLALVNKHTGGVQKPKAGVLASHDSITGAPENMKGEAVEKEASNFVTSIASISFATTTGKHPQGEMDEGAGDGHADEDPFTVADPVSLVNASANAKEKAAGNLKHAEDDKTKVPIENEMWNKMRPIVHILGQICDTWERFANALSPIAPFNRSLYRLRLAALLVPLLAGSFFITSYMFIKGMTFGIGFGFFGDPVISPIIEWVNQKFPHWQKILEPRNTILKGVPNNAQLTITLLRLGENGRSPLPPPPRDQGPPPDKPAELNDEQLRQVGGEPPLNATPAELDAAIKVDQRTPYESAGKDIDASKPAKHGKKGSRLLGFFKGTTKAGVETALGADHVKAKVGNKAAKDRLGVVPNQKEILLSGPTDFKCRYKGHKGHAYIGWDAINVPYLAFSTDKSIEQHGTVGREDVDFKPLWIIDITQISQLRKVGGFGWKAKLIVGWALEKQVSNALEIVQRDGSTKLVTAVPLRDELFNRACAMGGQKWESW